MLRDFHDIRQYKPFHICEDNAIRGFRIGGLPPQSISPKIVTDCTKYLLTIPLQDSLELSIFHSFDFESENDANPFDTWLQFYGSESDLIQFVLHSPLERGFDSKLASELSSHGIELSEEVLIDEPHGESDYYPYHKTGGIPYFSKTFNSDVKNKSLDLMVSDGYRHLFQLAFPVGPADAVIDGNWPFGECVFHVFAKENAGVFDFLSVWG